MKQMKEVRAGLLASHNKSYHTKKAMDAATDAELQETQKNMLGQIMRTVNRQIVRSVWSSCLDEDLKTPEQDVIRGIVATKEYLEILMGKKFDANWAWKPCLMPGIRLYVSLLHHFENVTEATNVNLVASVLEVMEAAQTANVYDIVE